jgi:hypothetical protein
VPHVQLGDLLRRPLVGQARGVVRVILDAVVLLVKGPVMTCQKARGRASPGRRSSPVPCSPLQSPWHRIEPASPARHRCSEVGYPLTERRCRRWSKTSPRGGRRPIWRIEQRLFLEVVELLRPSEPFTNWMADRLRETTADPTRRLFRRCWNWYVLARRCVAW